MHRNSEPLLSLAGPSSEASSLGLPPEPILAAPGLSPGDPFPGPGSSRAWPQLSQTKVGSETPPEDMSASPSLFTINKSVVALAGKASAFCEQKTFQRFLCFAGACPNTGASFIPCKLRLRYSCSKWKGSDSPLTIQSLPCQAKGQSVIAQLCDPGAQHAPS